MWKTWKTGLIVAGAGFRIWKPAPLPVESGMINPAGFHIPPSGRPVPAGRGSRRTVFSAACGKDRQCLPRWFIYSYFDADKGFSCHWIQKPFGRIRQRPQGAKIGFPRFPQHVEKPAFENQSLVPEPIRRPTPHPCHILSTDKGQNQAWAISLRIRSPIAVMAAASSLPSAERHT